MTYVVHDVCGAGRMWCMTYVVHGSPQTQYVFKPLTCTTVKVKVVLTIKNVLDEVVISCS